MIPGGCIHRMVHTVVTTGTQDYSSKQASRKFNPKFSAQTLEQHSDPESYTLWYEDVWRFGCLKVPMFAGVGDVRRRKLIFTKWLLCIRHGVTGSTMFSINSVTYHNIRRWKIKQRG